MGDAVGRGCEQRQRRDEHRHRLLLEGGTLYAINNNDLSVIAIDPTTGNRTRITEASSGSTYGNGATGASGLGVRWLAWDAVRNRLWTSGGSGANRVVAVDPSTAARTQLFCSTSNPPNTFDRCMDGPGSTAAINFAGLWIHPTTGNLIAGHHTYEFQVYEVETANSTYLSL